MQRQSIGIGLLIFGLGAFAGIVGKNFLNTSADIDQSSQGLQPPTGEQSMAMVADELGTHDPVVNLPVASLSAINNLTSDFEQSLALYELLDGMNPSEIVQMIEEATAVISGNDYLAATSIMYGRLAELNFDLALERVATAPPLQQKRWVSAVFHAMARIDLARAVAAAKTLPKPVQQVAALALLRSRDDLGESRRVELAATFEVTPLPTFSQGDPSLEWEEALQEPDIRRRITRLMNVATQWVGSDPYAAIAAVDSLPRMYRQGIQGQLVSQWAQNDFDSAWAWLQALPPSPAKQNLFHAVIGPLAQNDMARARSIVDGLPDRQRIQAMSVIAVPWAKQDLHGVVEWLSNEVPDRQRSQILTQLAVRLSMQDIELAEQLTLLLPEQEAAMMDGMLVSMLGNQDPERAAVLVDRMTDPQRRTQAAATLVRQWAEGDRDGAIRWIEEHEPAERGPLYRSLTTAWARWDSDGAIDFARSISDAGARDEALSGAIRPGGDIDSMELAYGEIENAEFRSRAALNLYNAMAQTDPARAEAFRETEGLDVGQPRQVQQGDVIVLQSPTYPDR